MASISDAEKGRSLSIAGGLSLSPSKRAEKGFVCRSRPAISRELDALSSNFDGSLSATSSSGPSPRGEGHWRQASWVRNMASNPASRAPAVLPRLAGLGSKVGPWHADERVRTENQLHKDILSRLQEDVKKNLLQPWELKRESMVPNTLLKSQRPGSAGLSSSVTESISPVAPLASARDPRCASNSAQACSANVDAVAAGFGLAPLDTGASVLDDCVSECEESPRPPPVSARLSDEVVAPEVPAGAANDSDGEASLGGSSETTEVTDETLDAMECEVQRHAMESTLSLHNVLISAENDIMEAAVGMAKAQAEVKEDRQLQISIPGRRKSNIPRTKAHGDALMSFLPKTLRQGILSGIVHPDQWKVLLESPVSNQYNPVLARYRGALVFADASGFTKLTETLASQPYGAEKIGSYINGFFGPVIDMVHQFGGDIIKFSGDALTIIWVAEDVSGRVDSHRETYNVEACAAAARFCISLQEKIKEIGSRPYSDGGREPPAQLTMHIGIGFGDIALLQVGGLLGRWEYCVAGNVLDQISVAEPLAASGETVGSPEFIEYVKDMFEWEDLAKADAPGYSKLGCATAPPLPRIPPWWDDVDTSKIELNLTKRYVPSAVALRLAALATAVNVPYPEEMRRVSVVFVSIKGLHPESGEPLEGNPRKIGQNRLTQVLMRLMQRSVYALEVSVNKFLVDDKGVLLLVAFGLPPLTHFTDDPVRATLCGVRLSDTLKNEGLQGMVGIATGQCWCGVVGTHLRREYTILGDTVNLSARIMGKANPHTVLTDKTTRDSCSAILDFNDEGAVMMKGKLAPVHIFRFIKPKKGLRRHRKQLRTSLLTWSAWPARKAIEIPLTRMKSQSGVMFITGTGGSGKTELVDFAKQFAREQNWYLLSGQNMDPSGTFALPRLCLQEAYSTIIEYAARDPYWRQEAWKLLIESLEPEGKGNTALMKSMERSGVDMQTIVEKAHRGPPNQAEIFWMLNTMIRHSTLEGSADLAEMEQWSPLLGLVVTQLSFGPRMINAMMERNDQHRLFNRFAELCAAVVDGFSRKDNERKGTMLLLHLRRSSSFFESRDSDVADAIEMICRTCMNRRREAAGQPETNPLVVCIVSRGGANDGQNKVREMAQECEAFLDVGHVDLEDTENYVQHMLDMGTTPAMVQRKSSAVSPTIIQRHSICSVEVKRKDHPAKPIVSEYIYEMTGGTASGVEAMLKALDAKQVITKRTGRGYRMAAPHMDVAWLRLWPHLPQELVGLAFKAFERLDPGSQIILKAATTLDRTFLRSALIAGTSADLDADEKVELIDKLLLPGSHLSMVKEMAAPPGDMWLKFQSGILRHIASTLVLEVQRNEVRRRTMTGPYDINSGHTKMPEVPAMECVVEAVESTTSLNEQQPGEYSYYRSSVRSSMATDTHDNDEEDGESDEDEVYNTNSKRRSVGA